MSEEPLVDEDLVGSTRPERIFAAFVDHVLAIIAMFASAAIVAELSRPSLAGASAPLVGFSVFLIYLLYFFLCEGAFSTTIGKFLFSLQVRQLDGRKCTWSSAACRTLWRLIEVNPILLGALPAGLAIYFSRRHQRIGDMISGTVVVSDSRSRY